MIQQQQFLLAFQTEIQVSKEGDTVEVTLKIALMSELVRTMVEGV
jgi:hypothetical protein